MRYLWVIGTLLWAQDTIWPGRILFELKPNYTLATLPKELEELRRWLDGTISLRFPTLPSKSPIYMLKYARDLSPLYVAKLWRRSPAVSYAEPEYVPRPFASPERLAYTPNDLHPANFCLHHLRVLQAWDSTKGDTNYVVGIVDTDVYFTHPDLEENIAYNWNDPINGIDDDGDGYIDNFHGWDLVGATYNGSGSFTPDNDPRHPSGGRHGTWVAGYAGATTDNGIGIAAPAFKCRILPIKAAPDNSRVLWAAYDGILYAAQKGAKVINCSWGGTFYSQAAQRFIWDVVRIYDPLIIAAAGNIPPNAPTKFYPAQYDGVYAVTAVNTADSWEGGVQADYGIDFATTGYGITTTGTNTYSSFGAMTSFASAQASGAAVLLRSWRRDLNARQAAELLRITADSVEPFNSPDLRYRLGRRLNLYRAIVTRDTPACRIYTWTAYDGGDDLFYAGETFSLSATYINYLSSVSNLTVSLEPLTPHLQVEEGHYTIGMLNTLETHPQSMPFRLRVLPSCPPNARLPVLFRFQGDGGYADYEVIEISGINPAFVNLDSAQLRTTIGGNGRIGYYDSPQNILGRGVRWRSSLESWLFEGGLLIADDTSAHLCTRRPVSGMYDHFTPISAGVYSVDPLYEIGEVSFMDAGGIGQNSPTGISGKGLYFQGRAYALRHEPFNPFVAFIYRVENTSNKDYADLSFGWWLDFDVDDDPTRDIAEVHSSLPLVYAYSASQNRYIGAVLLSDHAPLRAVGRVDTFRALLSSYLSLARGWSTSTTADGDIFAFIGGLNLRLMAGEADTIAFALVGGNTLSELILHATDAIKWYQCLLEGRQVVVDIGPDRTLCTGDSVNPLAPTAVSYYWSTGSTEPTFRPSTSGRYYLLVRDADGCIGYDEAYLTPHSFLQPRVQLVPGQALSVGDALEGAEISGAPYTYLWKIGEETYSGASFRHTFTQAGTYTLWLYRTDGDCRDSTSWEIVVSTSMLLPRPASHFHLKPNPTSGSFQLYHALPIEGLTALRLYDMRGRLVWETPLQPSGSIYHLPSTLGEGLYICEVAGQRQLLLYMP